MEVGFLQMIDSVAFQERDLEKMRPRRDMFEIEQFHKNTICITYRRGMLPIKEKTSDSGWGCMIRSLQMALAQTFVTITLGNNWKYNQQSMEVERIVYQLKSIINLFGDDPNNLFSIHRLVTRSSQHGVNEGQWWGPSFASDIGVEHINEMHVFGTRGYVAKFGQIITSKIDKLVYETEGKFNPCIIFVPCRLGPEKPDPSNKELIKEIFEIPQCMGMIGGEPNLAHYFHTLMGDELYYLDPHNTQQAVNMKKEWSMKSYFCKDLMKMSYEKLDPSVSIVFLVKTENDYYDFKKCFEGKKYAKLFTLKTEEDEQKVNYDDFLSIDSDFELSMEDEK